MSYLDKTLTDNNRRELNLHMAEINNIVPAHFLSDYPKLIALLEAYYEFLIQENEPNDRIQKLNRTRDVTEIDDSLLEFLEDELLLGKAYFQGWFNKREAAKFSNTLYRSKGSLYGIQQFFRAFYNIDVDVTYPREQILKTQQSVKNEDGVLESTSLVIGPTGGRITNDKLYQELAILIKAGLNVTTWIDNYKLFAHPAGMYLEGTVQIVSVNNQVGKDAYSYAGLVDPEMPDIVPEITIVTNVISSAIVSLGTSYYNPTTYVYDSADIGYESGNFAFADSATSTINTGSQYNEIVYQNDSSSTGFFDVYKTQRVESATLIGNIADNYATLQEFLDVDGATLDDSDMLLSNTIFDTFDKDRHQ